MNMNTGRGKYSAAPSALGYLYQTQYALLEALGRLSEGERVRISIETLDDVVFEADGKPIDILQTKHHINASASLTDTSPDLWKTLRIWIEGQANQTIPVDAQFHMITTAICGEGSAAAYLRPDGRDEEKALERLSSTASTSTNTKNAAAYHAFNALDQKGRANLLKCILVLDGSPAIQQIDNRLRKTTFYAVENQFHDSYLQRIKGWWCNRVVKHLADDNVSPILGEELESEANRIRNQFKEESLPVDDDLMRTAIDSSGYMDRLFVEQLNLIGVNSNRVLYAIKNYYRAFEQRSRWMREELLYVGELDRYEECLIEEWDLLFQQMRDDLGESAAEDQVTRAAQKLYKWVENGTHRLIRSSVTEPAIARGTYQILADDLRVGWHMEFREHLREFVADIEVAE